MLFEFLISGKISNVDGSFHQKNIYVLLSILMRSDFKDFS